MTLNYGDLNRRLDIFARAMNYDLIGLTQARVELGTASIAEVLGFRFPRLFRKWAAENERRDRESREGHERIQRFADEIRRQNEFPS